MANLLNQQKYFAEVVVPAALGRLSTKSLVIYHANCADGFGAAFACWLKLGDEAEYLPFNYADSSPDYLADLCKDREVYILDFSFQRKVMDHIFAAAKRVVWLDHHKTAFEMWLPELPCCIHHRAEDTIGPHYTILDNDKSGAYLAWEYFHPGTEVPMLIKHIDDYDRWQFKFDGTKAFNKALWSYAPWSFEQWNNFIFDHFYTQGEAILRAHDQNVQSVVKGASRKCFITNEIKPLGWVHGLAANCPPHLTSDVGHELANQSGTFGLCWTLSKEGMKAQCSLRSNGDYDVSAIAKVFGGGGHKNAAGFEVPLSTLIGWLK